MKKYLILVLLALLIGVVGVVWWSGSIASVSNAKNPVSVVIPKGTSASSVGLILKKTNLVRSPLAFKIYLQMTGKAGKILPGEFTLYQNQTLFEIVAELLKGPREIWVTIPEGLRREEIALKFADGLGKKDAAYQTFIDEFISLSKNSEGHLFPDTYLFPKDASAQKVYQKLIDTFEGRYAKLSGKLPGGFTEKEVVVLASLIERETKGNEEKPFVAGIILKRLESGWPLQIDATVQYAVGKKGGYWKPLVKTDLAVNSPYNTYRFKGLPPAPICNPGFESLKAAVFPQASPYWYYIHDGKGVIHYAGTIEEHGLNVSKYLGK